MRASDQGTAAVSVMITALVQFGVTTVDAVRAFEEFGEVFKRAAERAAEPEGERVKRLVREARARGAPER